MELKDTDLELKSKNITTKIKGILADEFPIIPKIEKRGYYKIKTEHFKSALDKILFAVSPSETRTEISGVFFNFNYPETGFLTLVGTDSYRLAEKSLQIEASDLKEKTNLIVPAKTLQELTRLIENNGSVEIYISENQILFLHDSAELISRIISEEYPDYKQIIPTSFTTNVILEKKSFLKAVKAVSLFARAGVNDINLKFDAQKDRAAISALNAQLGQSEVVLESEIKGGDNEIIFNYRYLLDGLLNISGDEVKLSIINDSTPAVLTDPGDKNYLYLVMPIKK
jgi:DNA polymerase-3 subunit beta